MSPHRRDLPLLIAGNSVSALGTSVYLITVTLLLKEMTGSPLVLGLFQFAALAPGFLLSPFTGALVDRASRRTVIVISDLARGALMVAAGIALTVPSLARPWFVLLVSLLAGVGHAVFVPAVQAFLPSLVPAERLHRATGIRATSSQLANLAGNAAGGALFVLLGAPVLFVANGVSFLLSGIQERFITQAGRPRERNVSAASAAPETQPTLLSDARAGLRSLVATAGLGRLVVSQAGLYLLSPVLLLSLPFVLLDDLGYPEELLGIFFALALFGAIVVFLVARSIDSARLIEVPVPAVAYGAIGVAFIAAGIATSGAVIALVAFLVGGASAAVYLYVTTWIQLRSPREMHGRFFAVIEGANALVAPLSYLAVGALLEAAGSQGRWALYAGAGGLAAIWSLTGARRYTRDR